MEQMVRWAPRSTRPDDLVRPVRLDPTGVDGPTRGQARGPRWRRCAPGLYVPSGCPVSVEQRILEQAARLGPGGAVTGWASLRWQGAAFFDGLGPGGDTVVPVPLVLGPARGLRDQPEVQLSRAGLDSGEIHVVDGVPVTAPSRALVDEVLRRSDPWEAASAVSMTAAAGLLRSADFRRHVQHLDGRAGVRRARVAAALGRDDLRSPREVWMHLVWELVAGLPRVPANVAVFSLDGSLLGVTDLLDVKAGLVGEYDGAHHRAQRRHRSDVDREERFRDHGLEYVKIVQGHSRSVAGQRFRTARARAAFLTPERRRWTVDAPWWWRTR